jgi:mono/diheme cytochrome c family protein
VLVLLSALTAGAVDAADGQGQYLFHAAGCVGCHTAENGERLAGGRAFATPFGTFYSPNITPDTATGIGDWTRAEFVAAVRHGRAPDGSAYFPAFPYPSYRRMTEEDVGLIYDYLMTVQAVDRENRPHDTAWWLARWMMRPWQWLFVDVDAERAPLAEPQLERGRYLVDALGHCGECHTPRNLFGVTDGARYLAGTDDGPEGGSVPNITSDREHGIGRWSADDIVYFLDTGAMPDGDYTGSHMAEVIDNTTSRLSAEDREAVAAYLRTVPPVPAD